MITPKLQALFLNKKMSSPLVLASGVLGTKAELLARVAAHGVGAVTTKSCGLKPRKGHENPTVIALKHGLLNAVGLSNPGVQAEIEEIKKLRAILKKNGLSTKIIASFFGFSVSEFVEVARQIIKAEPDFIEMNISCPNVACEFEEQFAANAPSTFQVVSEVKKVIGKMPLIVKLSPNVSNIVRIAEAAEDAGADALCAINTLLGMSIDLESGEPILANKMGGVSGSAIKPVAIRCVYQISQQVNIPIIGVGGVGEGKDALEMILAGADLVGIGSAVYQEGMEVFSRINQEVSAYLKNKRINDIAQLSSKSWKK